MLNFACIGGAWSAVQWPPAPEVKSRIDAAIIGGLMAARDINRGFKLAVTNKPEYWWRVDTNSGSTLGMGALGGQELVEGVIALTAGGAAAGGAAGASEAADVAGGLFGNMWSSAAGYITASLGIEVYGNIAADAISSVPLDMVCRAYLDK